MTTRVRLSLLFAGFSLVLLLGTLGYIYSSNAHSRQVEFFERLRTQCYRTAELLSEVQAADRDLLRVLDQNSIHRLYDEKVLLFNEKDELLYSSLDDEPIPYSHALLQRIRQDGDMNWRDADGDEVVGIHFTENGADYVLLASAFDKYGRRELSNLLRTLVVSLVLGSLFIFGAGYFFIGLAFRPLERLSKAIDNIDIDRLEQQLPVSGRRDEIDRLAVGYNAMLLRLRQAFELQRAFVNNASHELRTPLARMNAQVESVLDLSTGHPATIPILKTLQADILAQGDLVESLLLLQRLRAHIPMPSGPVRLDEVLFIALAEARTMHPDLQATVDIDGSINTGDELVVMVNELLLRTGIRNLLSNAASYSPDRSVKVELTHAPGLIIARFTNPGGPALPLDRLFQPFFRGPGSNTKPGSGLGLSIVQQVAGYAGGSIHYAYADAHTFTLVLPLASATAGA